MMLPSESLKNHVAILGKAGSGKTYAAKGIAEGLLDAGERVCIVDPTGVWHGLRSKANGKSGAYPIIIFGGEHADLPLGQVHGEAIAEIVATSNTPAIIDVSGLKVGERTRFFTDFANELLRQNRGPLHLFIDECHLFMPQGRVADPQSGNMLHAANNLISLGRAKGLRVTLISQRPAKVHKDSLSQVETMIALRLIAPQDRKAIEEWIADQADRDRGKEIIASLPSLATGQGWIWAPEIGVLKKVEFPRIKTFDSSRTPDGFTAGTGPVLAPIDIATISGKLVEIKEQADANDPVKLKAKIRELEKREPAAKHDLKAEQAAWADGHATGFAEAVEQCKSAYALTQASLANAILNVVQKSDIQWPRQSAKKISSLSSSEKYSRATTLAQAIKQQTPSTPSGLTAPQQKIVDALAFWIGIGRNTPSRAQVAAVAGYSVKSGGFNNLLSQLATTGVVTYPAPGVLALAQRDAANLMDADTAKQKMMDSLSAPERKVLGAFNGHAASRDEIAERSGYSPSSGGFNNLLSSLSSVGILIRPAPGHVDLADWVREIM